MLTAVPLPLGIGLALVAATVGSFLVTWALRGWYQAAAFVASSATASGRVVRLVTGTFPGSGRRLHFPVVEFEVGGTRREFQGSAGSARPSYAEGQAVRVLHDPRDPQRAQIARFAELYGALLAGGLLGSAFCAAAGFIGWVTFNPPAPRLSELARAGDLAAVRARLATEPGSVHETLGRNERPPLPAALGAGHCELAALLLEYGASVSAAARDGETALHLAAGCGVPLMQALRNRGARLDARSREGETPLHSVVRRGGRQAEVAWLLLQGADLAARDARGNTPLHGAGVESATVLCAAGADRTARNRAGEVPAQHALTERDPTLASWLGPGGPCERLVSLRAQGQSASDDALRAAINEYYCAEMQGEPVDPERPKRRPYQAGQCSALGRRLAEGLGVPRDEVRAVQVLALACDNGNAVGCARLARLYASGHGVPRDGARARGLYERACAGGDKPSCRKAEQAG